ncbi:MAG: putative baseplate assembly protein [Acidobacteriota bacterium]
MSEELDNCGCCDTDIAEPTVENPPGLEALSYRVGLHADALGRMLAHLSQVTIQDPGGALRHPLSGLSTRAGNDPSIALLDSWAVVGDVLSFYQERIANEGFLRTARERRSILELARLIGYELNAGVAAGIFLAFTVDTAQGAPLSAVVPAGTKVQSVPGQNELPQTFETSEPITARVEWNEIRPRLLRPQELALANGKLVLMGLSTGFGDDAESFNVTDVEPLDATAPLPSSGTIQAAEVDVIYLAATNSNLRAGDVLLFVGRKAVGNAAKTLVKVVRSVTDENELNRTRIELEAPQPAARITYQPGNFLTATASIKTAVFTAQTVESTIINQSWSDKDLNAFLNVQGWNASSMLSYAYNAYAAPAAKPKLSPAAPGAFAMRARCGFFGHNAPPWIVITKDLASADKPVDWDTSPVSIWKDSKSTPGFYADADCFLERVVPGITNNGWTVLELLGGFTAFRVKSAIESSLSGFGLSGKTSGLHLASAADGDELDEASEKDEKFRVRKTTAHVASERMALASLPIEDDIGAGTAEDTQLTLDRMVLNLSAGQRVAVIGERADLAGVTVSEVIELVEVQHSGGFTTVFFKSPGLQFIYIRKTVRLSANIAAATHGETVVEVLGSGAGTRGNQAFVLKRPPLTFIPAAEASGAQSSLEIRVNGILWKETASLLGLGPKSENYVLTIADDGKPVVIFGDGQHGARLPTGSENIVARYRTGIGSSGLVAANKATLLMTLPLGIRSATNPLASSGAADPEARDSARSNAPLTVRAMGRIVSLEDVADFARAFAGVGKTKASSLWRNGVRWVHLTVAASAAIAGNSGLPDYRLDRTSLSGVNLESAINLAKEPSMNVRLDTYQPVYFDVVAKVLIDPRYLWANVEPMIEKALNTGFDFAHRDFARRVSTAEVITAIQAVSGVVFVDIDELHRFDEPTSLLPADGLLIATDVQWAEQDPEPAALAQLLLVNPLGIKLTEVTKEAAQ